MSQCRTQKGGNETTEVIAIIRALLSDALLITLDEVSDCEHEIVKKHPLCLWHFKSRAAPRPKKRPLAGATEGAWWALAVHTPLELALTQPSSPQ